ncbi:hypothetical protein Ct9H90mP29_18710 [bacterium]|nr:MAG: hypothetical protein Ct9H90mP29_18710 [bacterium]
MILLSLVLAINPPQKGKFSPDGFWEKMNEQNIGQTYGDPGWERENFRADEWSDT